jgi:acetyl-CoA carboxylase, biotin carboxylase subunit
MSDVEQERAAPPFRRLLIANRGEIAVRVIRACRDMGIESVAVYSDADTHARHVRMADVAVHIGPSPAPASYLRIDAIVEAALTTRSEAVHPGYGFLSEQAPFAEAVEAVGIRFVGPTPRTLASLGDKLAARRSAREQDVPIVPGTFEPLPVEDAGAIGRIEEVAEAIGYPLLVKAAAGGGGRGMRRVDRREELPTALVGASHEARVAFGDGSVYLERYVDGGRHIEVQLLGDEHGNVVALGERDCSTQRRHQKLVEEAPAPGLSTERRRELHALAVRVARSVGLRNAATAEFLYSAEHGFSFLEVNARLQVEHGVTELVTGLDLVREQIHIAAGRPLSDAVLAAAEAAASPRAHAIELRISAEDPARDFAPMPGLLTRWREPAGPGVRMDSGVEEGWRVPGEYDPLLAKLLVVAADREQAISRARRALAEMQTGGVQTTVPFHAWLLDHSAFRDGDVRTDFVAREWDPAPVRAAAASRAAEHVARWAGGDRIGVPGAPAREGVSRGAGPGTPDDGYLGMPSLDDGMHGAGDGPRRASGAHPSDGWRAAGRREATERWP